MTVPPLSDARNNIVRVTVAMDLASGGFNNLDQRSKFSTWDCVRLKSQRSEHRTTQLPRPRHFPYPDSGPTTTSVPAVRLIV
eukprot:12323463-Alexandrium_andersonii.AAC.1